MMKRISVLVVLALWVMLGVNGVFAGEPLISQAESQETILNNRHDREPLPSDKTREYIVYTTEDVIRLRSATGLSTKEVLEGIGIAMQHLLQPETVLIMRQLGRDWDEVRQIAAFLRDGLLLARDAGSSKQRNVPGIQKVATGTRYDIQIHEMAKERFAISVSAETWQTLDLAEAEFMYLVFAAIIFDFSLDDAWAEAQTMSQDQLRNMIERLTTELYLPQPQEFQNAYISTDIPPVGDPLQNRIIGIFAVWLQASIVAMRRRWGVMLRQVFHGIAAISLAVGCMLFFSLR